MALKDPRFTKFRLDWHKEPYPGVPGVTNWYCTMGGVRVAEAVNTSSTGTDNYPWEWSLTEAGRGLRNADKGSDFGVADTLRWVKQMVDDLLRPAVL